MVNFGASVVHSREETVDSPKKRPFALTNGMNRDCPLDWMKLDCHHELRMRTMVLARALVGFRWLPPSVPTIGDGKAYR